MSTIVLVGLGMAAVGFGCRHLAKHMPGALKTINSKIQNLKALDSNSKYYKGGFETTMSKREACLILGISATASKNKVKDAHRKIMLLNHPDRGGSPYIAAKINQAKDFLENNK